jgi:hypothetical protein
LDQHKKVVKAAYATIQEVFPQSYIFPVYGNSDMFPSSYQPFNFSNTNGTVGYEAVQDAAEFLEEIRTDWNEKYLKNGDVLGDSNTHGYYHLKAVPYFGIETVDSETGDVVQKAGSLTNTEFIALTTNACHVSNIALLSTWGDPAEK